MSSLVMNAYLSLIQFDTYLVRRNFAGLYNTVRSCPVAKKSPRQDAIERACAATEMACLWYWKEVLCLQRSATTACLLRRLGIQGTMVIGAQQIPFKAHAWVEVDGRVVNDKPHVREVYAVLDVC
jgi:Transglutaminase-like superfamily